VPWVKAITDLIEPYRGDTPSHRSMRWLEAFDTTPSWATPSRRTFAYEHHTTREATVDRVVSISFIASLAEGERSRVARQVRELAPPGEVVTFPYRTDVWLTRKR
jgi:hypothetical protein